MDTVKQVEKFKDFLESYYQKDIHNLIRKGEKSLIIDFKLLSEFDIELAELLLNEPEEIIKAAELSLEQFEITKKTTLDRIRIRNLPESQNITISDIRSRNLGQFLAVEGIVRQASDIRPQVTYAKFECSGCGNTISIPQLEAKFREPSRCTCGTRGRFRLLSKILIDAQHLKIEENPEKLEGGEQPKRLSVFLKEDLVEPNMERKCSPGSKVLITGIIKEIPVQLKTGAQSIRYDIILEANHIEPMEETFSDILINEEEAQEIIEFSKRKDSFELLKKAIAPSISGHDRIKEALVLQMMGGNRIVKPDKTTRRGDIHILLCGDPGAGKSQLITFISKAAPKARYVSGKGTSGAGLCVAPDSLIMTNPGGIHKIENIVEDNLKNYEQKYTEGIWNSKKPTPSKKILTLDENLKIKSKKISQLWRIIPGDEMLKINTRTGKEIIITPNTSLFNGNLKWKMGKELKAGDYIATARQIKHKENEGKVLTANLINSNPVVLGIKKKLNIAIIKICKEKKITKREFCKLLNLSELSIYHNWINENSRGNIKLMTLKKICKFGNYPIKKMIDNKTQYSLYNGKPIFLPKYVNKHLLYFTGLISGDGDLSVSKTSYGIRFSNSNRKLIKRYIFLSKKLFGINSYITNKNSKERVESWRFCSKLVFEILNNLGIPQSPKSHKIDLNNTVLTMDKGKIAFFLRGYYDTDGGCILRKTKGSNSIQCTSTSKIFLEKLKLVLLRYGITSRIREREIIQTNKIKPKHRKYEIIISGGENLKKFKESINFYHNEKKKKLNLILKKITKYHTNNDIIPPAKEILRAINPKILKKINNNSLISRKKLKEIIKKIGKNKSSTLNKLAESDIFWDKIKIIEKIKNPYKYVYDLTVEKSHNFIVNGILVHNTAAVVKDEFLKGWSLEAGALVLANQGIVVVDELDKMGHEDRSALHEALEQQTISISKANIQATLRAQTTLLAAANPKLGRFDPYTPIAAQIDLPASLINRFDLIFPIRDIPNKEKDEVIAMHVLQSSVDSSIFETEVTTDFLKKYVAYAKSKIIPKLTKGAINEIKTFYVQLRNSPIHGDENAIRPIPISARQLEGLVRLAEASAKTRLSDKVSREDAKRAIELLRHCLMEVGFDPETGQIDIDRITTGISTSTRNKILTVKEIISSLEAKGMKSIPIEEIIAAAAEKGIEESTVEESIEKLKRSGDLFEPKKGHISRI